MPRVCYPVPHYTRAEADALRALAPADTRVRRCRACPAWLVEAIPPSHRRRRAERLARFGSPPPPHDPH